MPYLADSHDLHLFRAAETTTDTAAHKKSDTMNGSVQKMTSFPALEVVEDKSAVACVEGSMSNDNTKVESKEGDMMEGVEYTSRPPSPPESGAATPTLRIAQCPLRLRPLVPPPNYGAIKNGAVFRSAFPQDRNVEFLKDMEVRTVLCLVGTEPSEPYSRWIQHGSIKRLRIDIAANKEGKIKTTWDSLCEALLIVMDCANYPLYIHCNQGRHRTGCVVACFRKIQRWPIEDILAEYKAYASPKAREGDIDLIRAFDPEAVFEYAKTHGYLDDRPFMKRMDSAIGNIDALAEALSSRDVDDYGDISGTSNASTFSDDGVEMRVLPGIDPCLANSEEHGKPIAVEMVDHSAVEMIQDAKIDASGHDGAGDWTNDDPADPAAPDSADTTTTVVELAGDAMTPPAVAISNPLA